MPRAGQHHERGATPGDADERIDAATAWQVVLAARRAVDAGAATGALAFSFRGGRVVPGTGYAGDGPLVVVDRATGGVTLGAEHCFSAEGAELLHLFLGMATVPRARGLTVAVLGQSLDGYIATAAGESRCINGPAGLAHLHRLRALSDAVIVGASTAALDRPRLTTRLAEGPSPVRVVLDPNGRLPEASPLLRDGAAATLVFRAGEGPGDERLTDQARIVRLPSEDGELPPAGVLAALRVRGLTRVLVEGGGDTVSRFLARGLLDRLQLLVSPVLLGAGRPAVRLPAPPERLADASRPPGTQHLLGGGDVLFDLRPGSR